MQLFISHSSKDNALALAVEAELKKMRGVGTLLDRSGLEPASAWRRELHMWMARCNSALVLITEGVLAEPRWVLKEAIILGWRRDLEGDAFKLFWALGPGVTRKRANEAGFNLAQLDDTQRLATSAAEGQHEALVNEMLPLLPAKAGVTAFDRLAGSVARLLRVADPQGVNIPMLISELGIDTPAAWGPDRIAQLADLVARALLVGRDEGFAVDRIVGQLSGWDAERSRQLAHLLAPRWVEADAAATLRALAPPKPAPGAAPQPAAVPAAAIAGQYVPDYTTEMFVRRAFELDDTGWVLAEAVECDSTDLFGTLRVEICQSVRQRRLLSGSDDRIVAKLRTSRIPYFVPLTVLPPADTLKLLHAEFPRVLFVAPPAEPQAAVQDGVHEVQPPPDPVAEDREYAAWQGAMAAITNR
jgi:hypothetical protein